MLKTNRIVLEVNGKPVDPETIQNWEFKRLVKAHRLLTNIYGVRFSDDYSQWVKTKDVDALQNEILRVKMHAGADAMKDMLKSKYDMGNASLMMAEKVSGGRHKFSTAEIVVPESSLSVDEIKQQLLDTLLTDNNIYTKENLAAEPDHFVFQQSDENVQEVLEIIGKSPFPTHYFVHFNDLAGVHSPQSAGYEDILAGTLRLSNGSIIGGVHHQIKPEKDGFRIKATVEFPTMTPLSLIHSHQIHLACEFGYWISDILD